MAPGFREIDALLDSLAAGETTAASELTVLSDMTTQEAQHLREVWDRLSSSSKIALLARTTVLADDNVDLDFTQLARVALGDPAGEVRALAAEALWESTDRHVGADLTRLLRTDPDASVRASAAGSLRQFVLLRELGEFNTEQGDEIVAALKASMQEGENSLEVRVSALEALGPRSLPWVSALISQAYYDDAREMRLAAVAAMGASADEQWLEYLFEQLQSDDPEFRFKAATALGLIAAEEAVEPLAEVLDDDDSEVQLAAVTALGEVGGPAALRHLRDFRGRVPDGLEEALEEAIETAAIVITDDGDIDEADEEEEV
jgi:HEAT repeat protein